MRSKARVLEITAALRAEGGVSLPPAEQGDNDRWSAAIEAVLGPERFAAETGAGRECPWMR